MRKSTNEFMNIGSKRMLSAKEASFYTGLGKNNVRIWGEKIGAVRKIGKRVLFDRLVIDQELNSDIPHGID